MALRMDAEEKVVVIFTDAYPYDSLGGVKFKHDAAADEISVHGELRMKLLRTQWWRSFCLMRSINWQNS
eukprot:7565179-Karenia_brevis.AAC.1